MLYLGKDSSERSQKRRESLHRLCYGVGHGYRQLWNQCLIHKTLVYKTLESLIKCASEVSVWVIKGEAVSIRSHLPQLSGGAPQVLSSLSQLMQKCRVGSLGKTLPVLAAMNSVNSGRQF